MTFIIGDIHGEITKLLKLTERILSFEKNPSLIFIGDYIDKGENARATLSCLKQLSNKYSCTFLVGNHEYCWMNMREGNYEEYLMANGAKNTIQSFDLEDIEATRVIMLNEYSDFFAALQSYTIQGDYFICHSGIPPELYTTAPQLLPTKQLLFNRYEFIKESRLYLETYKIVFGHTGFFSPYVDLVKIGIDTAACFLEDQPLSAFCIDENCILDSDGARYSVEGINIKTCPNIVRSKPWRFIL